MECYFLSSFVDEEGKPVRGYRRIMYNILKKRYDTEITEQGLCDQAKMIRKNEWMTKLENLRRKAFQREKNKEVNNNDNTSERFNQDEENIYKNETTQVDAQNLGEERRP